MAKAIPSGVQYLQGRHHERERDDLKRQEEVRDLNLEENIRLIN